MYDVVFEYKQGPSIGCRTRLTFRSKEAFDELWKKNKSNGYQCMIEEGVSEERALQLLDEIPKDAYINAMMRHDIKELTELIVSWYAWYEGREGKQNV